MKTKLEQIFEYYLNGREIIVWGNPTRLFLRELKQIGFDFRIASNKVNSINQYVIAITEEDWDDFKLDEQYLDFEDVKDCVCYSDIGGEMPFDWECYGGTVGKHTYFGSDYAYAFQGGYINSIGRFTSINESALINVDHQYNMTFVSDEVVSLFSDKDKELFTEELLNDPKLPKRKNKSNLVEIGNDVWIGANSFINCSKVKQIGDGAIIGAGAVVLEDVPPYAVVVGVPAKIVRYRYDVKQIETLLRVKWWEWDDDTIRKNAQLLISPEKFFDEFI